MPRPQIPNSLRRLVTERAHECCEYCLLPQFVGAGAHQMDHLVAVKHGGETVSENLALACVDRNQFKGSDLSSIDPVERKLVSLFDPRTQQWRDHFQLRGAQISGLTPTGRATIVLLRLNDEERLADRQALMVAGLYPPPHLGT